MSFPNHNKRARASQTVRSRVETRSYPLTSFTPIKDNEHLVKARVNYRGETKEFFVYAVSEDEFNRLNAGEDIDQTNLTRPDEVAG